MKKLIINHNLFQETSHSPALTDIVGKENTDQVIDFCFIANPYYPTDEMITKLKNQFVSLIKAYPSSNPKVAQIELAKVLNINPDHLIIGNGATELITLIQQELVEEMAIPIPTFSEYLEKLNNLNDAVLYQLKENNDYQLNLQEFAQWIDEQKISSALIINPGNPTGQFMPVQEMLDFLNKMTHLKMVLVDESFIDFSGIDNPSLMPYLDKYPNLMIVRSMSKHCGVPGLRLGYCCSSNEKYFQKIKHLLPIWNINTIAEYFLGMLNETDSLYQDSVKQIVSDIKLLYQNLKEVSGYKVYPTGSNFILIKILNGQTARNLQIRLLEDYGLYVRDCSNKIGLDEYHIRIASQGKEKDQKLIDALRELSM